MNGEFRSAISEAVVANPTFTTEEGVAAPSGAHITIMKAGRSKNPRFYRPEALKKAAEDHLFDGVRMFQDHSEKDPNKRSFSELVAGIKPGTVTYNATEQTLEGDVTFFDPAFAIKAQAAKDFTGVSFKGIVHGQRVRQGKEVIEDVDELLFPHSVDWVIYPAAGGQLQSVSESEEGEEVEWASITSEDLKKNRPDLFESLAGEHKEEKPALTQEAINQMVADGIAAERTNREAAAAKRAQVAKAVEESVAKAGLPTLTKNRLITQLSALPEFDQKVVDESIAAAQAELKAVAGPKIVGEGVSGDVQNASTHPAGISVAESLDAAFGIKKSEKK